MRLLCPLTIVLINCGIATAADLVPFALPWDDATPGPTNISSTIDKPAGKYGFVHIENGHLCTGDRRLRLFGANLTAAANFPDHETANKVAARMAKFGLNAARLHFLDATFGSPQLIEYASGNSLNWNAEALDRLDYWVAQLKKHGLYIDVNLLVGRRFGVGDNVDSKINNVDWKTAHAVGFFYAPHYQAQKEYARQLLTHVNPYTGNAYAAESAVALVEINNENGLIHTWLAGGLDNLPDEFAQELHKQWNKWLVQRYVDTEALARSWGARDEPLGQEMLADQTPGQPSTGWKVEQHGGADVDLSPQEDGTAVLHVKAVGDTDWHVQFNHSNVAINKSAVYTVSFIAAADCDRKVYLSLVEDHQPWANLGLGRTLNLTKQLQPFAFTFTANNDEDHARLSFNNLNQLGATLRFAKLSLKPGGRVGPGRLESLGQRNIATPTLAAAECLLPEHRQDWIRFLWETERKYWTEMLRFLKEDLGVKSPIVGTCMSTSTPSLMAEMDVIDSHAYWDAPQFPGKAWDMDNWFINNVSMVDDLDNAAVTQVAFQHVVGKPHVVSEYNHPAPNIHAAEGPLFVAAIGALQDWDAIFLYTYSHDLQATKSALIPGFFDIGPHPAVVTTIPAASLLFRRADIAPAQQIHNVPLSSERELQLIAQGGRSWNVLPIVQLGVDLAEVISCRVGLDLSATPSSSIPHASKDHREAEVEDLTWRRTEKGRGIFEVRSLKSKVIIGHVDNQSIDLGQGVRLSGIATQTNWCAIALTLLEGKSFEDRPRRALLVASGITENTNMGWKDGARNTVGRNWGKAPSLVEPICATITIPRGPIAPKLYPLDQKGHRGPCIIAKPLDDRHVQFQIVPLHRTIWYEIDYSDES